ncbi:type I secretion system permease/ATPase [Alsobacter sp. R-9]
MLKALLDTTKTTPLRDAARELGPALRSIAAISLFLNLLAIAPALYMMSAYERVLSSRNDVTWAFLTLLLVAMGLAYALLTNLRTRALVRIGIAFDNRLSDDLFAAVHRATLNRKGTSPTLGTPVQAMRDLDTLRDNLSGRLVASGVDLLFAPLFLLACAMLHPLIGVATLAIMAAVGILGFVMNSTASKWSMRSMAVSITASEFAGSMMRNAEAIQALGMVGALQSRWKKLRDAGLGWSAMSADSGSWASVGLTFATFAGATLVASVTLLLVIENIASASVLFGAMILSGKAIAPMSALASNWKAYLSTNYAFERIDRLFLSAPAAADRVELPKPLGGLAFENVSVVPPGGKKPVLRNISFDVEPGEILGVIGPSAAGKSSLARVITGVWQPTEGSVRLDGSELNQWHPDELGRHVGYIPQDVELFAGSVAENIARFSSTSSEAVIKAAQLAGVHEMIQNLEDGYNTEIGEAGAKLSGGQRQRLALARAVFGRPPLIVLDEPNASLDTRGEESLVQAIRALAKAGSTVVLITHRANIMSHVDKVLVMADGGVHLFGPRDEVLRRLATPNTVQFRPVVRAS